MPSALSGQTTQDELFELKSSSLTVPVLKLFDSDIELIASELAQHIEQAPGMFHNAPIVIDLSAINEAGISVDLPLMVGLVRGLGMLPVGFQSANEAQQQSAELLEMAVLGRGSGSSATPKKRKPAPQQTEAAPNKQVKPATTTAKSTLITRPVRSGQRIYARGADLVIIAAVSSGAEIYADGNIHVYGALRGRAMAGVNGNKEARIFCHKLEAELISIAGRYKVSENLTRHHWGEAVQISLKENSLLIEPL